MSDCCELAVVTSDEQVLITEEVTDLVVITDAEQIIVVDSDVNVTVIDIPEYVVINDGQPGPAGPPGPGSQMTLIARETLQAYQAVAIDLNGLAYSPSPTVAGDISRVVGIANTAALTSESLVVTPLGLLLTGATWTLGRLYVGAAGALTSTPPSTGWHLEVAVAMTAAELYVRLVLPVVLI